MKTFCLLGAVSGDIIGSTHEYTPQKKLQFDLFSPASKFTDDTVLTIAVADAILNKRDYADTFREYGRRYPDRGYGGMFQGWLHSVSGPYDSFGNGSAMRVSPVGWAMNSAKDVLAEAKRSAEVTHNHPEGIKGAQAVALAVFRARTGASKAEIRSEISDKFGYKLNRTLAEIRQTYKWSETCQGSVPESIIAFLESDSYENAVRSAVAMGGDADTMAAIAGSIAEPYYGGVPAEIAHSVRKMLPAGLWTVIERFSRKYYRLEQK